ncbi:hypothetical protein [Kutzneria kofuensis]|uniref:Uncharacterized protein n=1 Tax=Kutzneria kofuensis TaxID=103725 RepID=A0A7W9KT26_9PSEU|nr:hypothetical protein [Kutzneria kofuensis]MBB5897918.1 hypothetical protein [Kutzneria kofuensis]
MHKGVASRPTSVAPLAPGLFTGPASAASVTGNATYFAGLGSPYGGCGLPQSALDSQNFVALNVFDTPGQPFCRNGSWVADRYDGATLTMLVADSCADSDAWCRDDPNHLDLAQNSLNRFAKDGLPVGDMYPGHWNNRRISWQFVPAPGCAGDIRIGFIQSAQPYWPVIAVSHLPNGIHGVQYYSNGTWHDASMDSDLGQDYRIYRIGPTSTSPTQGTQYRIRVVDASGALVAGGRTYRFALPSSCANGCGPAYTTVTYTTS